MDLRHLRYFIAVAEELHFARAAERLHMEQSPLSRAIKDLEYELGAQLFDRTTRSTRITWAGEVLLSEARRIITAVDQAKASVRAAANGFRGFLRVGLSDGIAQPRLASLFARSREEEPDVEIRVFEMPFAQQVSGLHNDLLDVGFALAAETSEGIKAEAIWHDPIAAVLPARHPLAKKKRVDLREALQSPLVMCHPEVGSGCHTQLDSLIHKFANNPIIADYATTLGVMMTLVGAGYGIGFAIASQAATIQRPDVVVRPLAGRAQMLTTYMIRSDGELSEPLARFIERARPQHDVAPSP